MSFYLKNNTSNSRYILIGTGKNAININIGPSGAYSDNILVDEAYENDPTIKALLASGVLSKVSADKFAPVVAEQNDESEKARRAKEQALVDDMNKPRDEIIIKTCSTCEKEFGVASSKSEGTDTCERCIEAKALAALATEPTEEVAVVEETVTEEPAAEEVEVTEAEPVVTEEVVAEEAETTETEEVVTEEPVVQEKKKTTKTKKA